MIIYIISNPHSSAWKALLSIFVIYIYTLGNLNSGRLSNLPTIKKTHTPKPYFKCSQHTSLPHLQFSSLTFLCGYLDLYKISPLETDSSPSSTSFIPLSLFSVSTFSYSSDTLEWARCPNSQKTCYEDSTLLFLVPVGVTPGVILPFLQEPHP